jgi:MSHA pilin protein MshA
MGERQKQTEQGTTHNHHVDLQTMEKLNMKTHIGKLGQKGFTLIELIITIVIIGVLAAVAIPKFQDLTGDAEKGVAAGVASSLASGTSVNYGRSKVPGAVACTALNTPAGCTYYPMTTCANIESFKSALADIPAGYTVTDSGTTTLANTGTAVAGCQITKGTINVGFSAYGA